MSTSPLADSDDAGLSSERLTDDDLHDHGYYRKEPVLPEIVPWLAIMVIWLSSMAMLSIIAAVAPPVIFDIDWGFGLLVAIVAIVAIVAAVASVKIAYAS